MHVAVAVADLIGSHCHSAVAVNCSYHTSQWLSQLGIGITVTSMVTAANGGAGGSVEKQNVDCMVMEETVVERHEEESSWTLETFKTSKIFFLLARPRRETSTSLTKMLMMHGSEVFFLWKRRKTPESKSN